MQPPPTVESDAVTGYLEDCRARVLEEIRRVVPASARHGGLLYELMLDYPLRHGKALRPALCIAACRLLGGHVESVLRTAAVLELYHNAFLIHDDVEDGSERRRNEATLHELHGVPIAVNVGDGMLALTLEPLLQNIELVGLGRALRILETVARMARESAEGQMMELEWVRRGCFTPSDRDYVRMVYKKTCWYTFLAPLSVGAIAAGGDATALATLRRVATPLGIAFQIQDDVLNLVGEEQRYGKEIGGDLWEGKHTLALIHSVRQAGPDARERILAVLRKRRPPPGALGDPAYRTEEDVAFLRERIERSGAIDYALAHARRHAGRARRSFESAAKGFAPSVHRDFLAGLVDFVVKREW
jgi:geranylgeranyl diphosphate synthase type II